MDLDLTTMEMEEAKITGYPQVIIVMHFVLET